MNPGEGLPERIEKILGVRGGEGPTLREQLQALRETYGSNRAAARALGINESIFRRALSGGTRRPKLSTLEAVGRGYRDLAAKKISNEDIRLPVTPILRGTASSRRRGGRERDLKASNLKMTAGAAERIRDAYVSGGSRQAAAQFVAEIKDRHYRSFLIPDWLRDQIHADELEGDYGYTVG